MKKLIKIFICLLFSAICPLLYGTNSNPGQGNIIYEYKIITQKKGQSLESALKKASLTPFQNQLIKSIPVMREAKSKRTFLLTFVAQKKLLLLREVRVTRDKRIANFVLKNVGGELQFVSQPNTITEQAIHIPIKLEAIKPSRISPATTNKKASTKRSEGNYHRIRFYQKKGRSLSSSMKSLSLTSAQKALINKLPVMKQAKSTRQINLLFERKGNKRYLKAANVIRGNNRADFVLVNEKGKLLWSNKKGEVSANSSASFLRYPLNFSRISSPFNLRRRHPITRRIRPHKGVDLKAPHGRSVWAPADGVVTFSGRQRGYGITLVIDHQNGYKTKYAHLSRIMKGARKGRHVKKKQIIARVGNTGFSTGAHLHYEVILRGRNRNPLTVTLPGGGGSKKLPQGIKNAKKYLPKLQQLMR